MASMLPKVLRTKSNLALEECIAEAFRINITKFLIYLIDNVDIRILKFLAFQFHILGDEGWNLCDTEKEQRELLKVAVRLHRKKGTKTAIEYCLNVFGINGKVEQWYEYGGRINRFKIDITLMTKTLTDEAYKRLLRYINLFKNKRAILENVDVSVYPQGNFYVFPRAITDEFITIKGARN